MMTANNLGALPMAHHSHAVHAQSYPYGYDWTAQQQAAAAAQLSAQQAAVAQQAAAAAAANVASVSTASGKEQRCLVWNEQISKIQAKLFLGSSSTANSSSAVAAFLQSSSTNGKTDRNLTTAPDFKGRKFVEYVRKKKAKKICFFFDKQLYSIYLL